MGLHPYNPYLCSLKLLPLGTGRAFAGNGYEYAL